VSNFDYLHPAIQHHVVNSLGWRELRPFQEAVIPPILAGKHMIVLAPTAGGKTEAAFLPLASGMLSEGWTGLSVLYICPIKALLNNLDVRLQRYSTLLGRRSAIWHGDVTTTAQRHVLRDPPDLLLTTPDSLELMLVSPNIEARSLFGDLRAIIVDELTFVPRGLISVPFQAADMVVLRCSIIASLPPRQPPAATTTRRHCGRRREAPSSTTAGPDCSRTSRVSRPGPAAQAP